MLPVMPIVPTRPMPSRSSGTNERATPISRMAFGLRPTSSSFLPLFGSINVIEPPTGTSSPAIASSSDFWPAPAMPAMPKISPLQTSKETPSSVFAPYLSTQLRSFTRRRGVGLTGSMRSISRSTLRPTIMSVSDFSVASAVSTEPIYSPLRSTATRSDSSSTSLSLCVMMMIALPSERMLRSTSKRRSVSCGVRTAVGSSRIRMSAPR